MDVDYTRKIIKNNKNKVDQLDKLLLFVTKNQKNLTKYSMVKISDFLKNLFDSNMPEMHGYYRSSNPDWSYHSSTKDCFHVSLHNHGNERALNITIGDLNDGDIIMRGENGSVEENPMNFGDFDFRDVGDGSLEHVMVVTNGTDNVFGRKNVESSKEIVDMFIGFIYIIDHLVNQALTEQQTSYKHFKKFADHVNNERIDKGTAIDTGKYSWKNIFGSDFEADDDFF